MRLAETVTFSGQGHVDRCAEFRRNQTSLRDLRSSTSHRFLVVWRGKILMVEAEAGFQLAALHSGFQSVWQEHSKEVIFLGKANGIYWSAIDMSGWEPDSVPETVGAFVDPTFQTHPDFPKGSVFAELRSVMSRLAPADAELAATAKALLGWHEIHRFCAACGNSTEVTNAGWQRDCSRCGASHFPRTDPVVIMLITNGNDLLLGRSPGWPEKMYSLLAGFVEPGETIEAAVRREVKEETSVSVGDVIYLASQPWPFPSSVMLGCWGKAKSRDITIDPLEIEDAIWVGREEVADAVAGNSDKFAQPRRGSIAQFLIQNWLADKWEANW